MFEILPLEAVPSMPWKNGLGTTRELVRYPADPSLPFQFRFSQAEVSADSPFSKFDGYHRQLFLLKGGGLELMHETGLIQRLSQPGHSALFNGAWTTFPRLLRGPIQDLNVIFCPNTRLDTLVLRQGDTYRLALTTSGLPIRPMLLFALCQTGECHGTLGQYSRFEIPAGYCLHGVINMETLDHEPEPQLELKVEGTDGLTIIVLVELDRAID